MTDPDPVARVLERVASWPAREDPWWAIDWPFDAGSKAQALTVPWLLGVNQARWLEEHGSAAILLAFELTLAPPFMDRVLGDLCRKAPVIDRQRALKAGPATPARAALWERLQAELPAALSTLRRIAAMPVAVGPNGEGFRQGYIAGAWEEHWRGGQIERGEPLRPVLQAIARNAYLGVGSRRWLKGYQEVVRVACKALDQEEPTWKTSTGRTRRS